MRIFGKEENKERFSKEEKEMIERMRADKEKEQMEEIVESENTEEIIDDSDTPATGSIYDQLNEVLKNYSSEEAIGICITYKKMLLDSRFENGQE